MLDRDAKTVGTISAQVLLRIVDFVASRGHDPGLLCQHAGIDLETLRDPALRVPYAMADCLGQHAEELTGDSNIGLHLAQDVRDPQRYDVGMLLLMSSPSIRAGFERLVRYQRFWGDGERCSLVPVPGGACVRFLSPSAIARTLRHADECAMAEVVVGLRVLCAEEIVPSAVRFRHDAPANTVEHRAFFRSKLEFGCAHTEIELDDGVLNRPMKHANETYSAIFQLQVEAALERLPAPSRVAESVRSAAKAALATGECTLVGTARAMGVSVRTLQRRLQADGTSFGELVDSLRREMAVSCLARGMTVPQISWMLGYADSSAFHHAFKRWTGMSPEQARVGQVMESVNG